MNRVLSSLLMLVLLLAFAGADAMGQTARIRIKDGSTWRGQVGDSVLLTYLQQGVNVEFAGTIETVADLYVVVEGNIAGEIRKQTIFRDDIVSLRTVTAEEMAEKPIAGNAASGANQTAAAESMEDSVPRDAAGRPLGVFLLPLDGMVGIEFRHEEILEIGKEADKYGDGQIIVLLINSNGGLVSEALEITEAIRDLQKRHRVVAWIKKAISAGCSTAMSCREIYFQTEGTAGSVTTLMGSPSAPEPIQEVHAADLAKLAEESGYSRHIAYAMKMNKYLVSYDKDPVTGEVTWYGDKSGEFLLSDENHNLTFTSSNALHSGFSKGTADTEEELAKVLDLPKWYEVSDYGRRIAENWQRTAELAQEEIPRLRARMSYWKSGSLDSEEVLGARIRIIVELIRWWDRAPNVCMMSGLPPKETLERVEAEYRRDLARLRKMTR